jgi:sulfate-transporting ATPase
MPAEFIYSTYKLARHYPPDRTVLEDISISFFPGAKIGVIGPNGAGKSSLLRIMAGLDDGFTGEARLTPRFTVGYLSQEPQLDPAKDVKGNVMDGVHEVQALLDQYNAVMARWSDPDADYEAIGLQQGVLEDRINAADAWNVERNVEIAMEGPALPAGRRPGRDALRRREAPGRAGPAAPAAPRPAPARRAHEPPRRRVGRVARALPR